LEKLADELCNAHGVEAICVEADLTSDTYLKSLTQALDDRHVSVLVNNAGIGLASPFHLSSPERLETLVRLNCLAPTVLPRPFLPARIAQCKRVHVLLGSVAAYQPLGHYSVYAATKAYILMMGEALWAEQRSLGMDSLVLSPGLTQTEFQAISGTQARTGMADPATVVEAALKRLGGAPSYVPGFSNKLAVTLGRLVPRPLLARISELTARSMLARDIRDEYDLERHK